ncbi:hypothetical protein [Streptomyces sp. NPDC002067]
MLPDDVAHLDRLARRADGLGPVAVLEPLAANMLSVGQGAGTGALAQWTAGATARLYGGGGAGDAVTVSVDAASETSPAQLVWGHPSWPGYPVPPGTPVTWWCPGLVEAGAAARMVLGWLDATGKGITTVSGGPGPLVAVPPPGAAYALPAVLIGAVGVWTLGGAVLAVGDISAALLAGDRPHGEGAPAYSITGYSHSAVPGAGEHRDIGLELVEVAGAAR